MPRIHNHRRRIMRLRKFKRKESDDEEDQNYVWRREKSCLQSPLTNLWSYGVRREKVNKGKMRGTQVSVYNVRVRSYLYRRLLAPCPMQHLTLVCARGRRKTHSTKLHFVAESGVSPGRSRPTDNSLHPRHRRRCSQRVCTRSSAQVRRKRRVTVRLE